MILITKKLGFKLNWKLLPTLMELFSVKILICYNIVINFTVYNHDVFFRIFCVIKKGSTILFKFKSKVGYILE